MLPLSKDQFKWVSRAILPSLTCKMTVLVVYTNDYTGTRCGLDMSSHHFSDARHVPKLEKCPEQDSTPFTLQGD